MTSQEQTRASRRAVWALLGVTLIWGWTFVWMKQAMLAAREALASTGESESVAGEAAVSALFMLLRFGTAAIVLPLVLPSARRGLTARVWLGGLVLGGMLYAGFLLQMLGLANVSPSVSAFLTSLYVVFTAFITAMLHRRAPTLALIAGALLATVGAAYIGGPPQLTFGWGEWLTIACAVVFALHIVLTDRLTKRLAPVPVTLTSFVTVAAGSAVTLAVVLLSTPALRAANLVTIATTPQFVVPLALSTVFATLIAITLMNVFQREIDPVRAAILYAIEPVWAAGIAIAYGLAIADRWLWIGGGALLAGNLVAEIFRPSRASSDSAV